MPTEDDSHTIGQHSGVTEKRLDELRDAMVQWLVDEKKKNKDEYCACEAINAIAKIGKTKAEVATLGVMFGHGSDSFQYLAEKEYREQTAN